MFVLISIGEDTETIKDLTDLENVNFTLLLQQQATIEQERRSPSLEEIHQDNADVVVTESTVEKHEFLVATPNADKSPISSETGQPHALVIKNENCIANTLHKCFQF